MWIEKRQRVRKRESLANLLHVVLVLGCVFFKKNFFFWPHPHQKKGERCKVLIKNWAFSGWSVKNKCHICYVQHSLGRGKSLYPYAIAPAWKDICLPTKSSFLGILPQFPCFVSSCFLPSLWALCCLLPEPCGDAAKWTLWLWDIQPNTHCTAWEAWTTGFLLVPITCPGLNIPSRHQATLPSLQ